MFISSLAQSTDLWASISIFVLCYTASVSLKLPAAAR